MNWPISPTTLFNRAAASRSMLKQIWHQPVFANILENRTETLTLVGAGALQIGLHLLGLPGWACPFKQLFGFPCPGCGLTTATGLLFHGQFRAALQTHAFAPIFMGAFLLMGVVGLLPKNYSAALVTGVARLENKTGLTAWLLSALMIYWVARLLGFL